MIVLALLGVLLVPIVTNAATYYADNLAACTGNYNPAARNCTGSSGNSYTTFAGGVAPLAPGDTLYIRQFSGGAGVWDQQIDLQLNNKSGTPGNYITIAGYPGETPTIQYSVCTAYGMVKARGNRGYFIFKDLILDGVNQCVTGGATKAGWSIRDGNHHFTLQRIELKNQNQSGLFFERATDILVEDSQFHDARSDCAEGNRAYGWYISEGSRITIRRNRVYNMPGGGAQIYPGPLTDIFVYDNDIADNTWCSTSNVGGVTISNSAAGGALTNVQVYRNLIHGNGVGGAGGWGGGIQVDGGPFPMAGIGLYNNTIYDNQAKAGQVAWGIRVFAAVTPGAVTAKNNLIVGNGTGQISDAGNGNTFSHNRTTGAITDCTASTTDFTQKAGSACIDAGTNVGFQFNGAAPDIGAFEAFTFASCQVPFGAANTIQVNFTSNLNLLGSTLTTFTARRNGSNNALTGTPTKIGDTIVSLPVTTTYVGGDTVDWSWASGGFTDNARIGGTLNQPFLPVTNQSCTNNAGGAPPHVFTQARYQFRGVRGPETTTDVRGADNHPVYEVQKGGAARARFVVTCSVADCPDDAFFLRYSKDGGPYTIVPADFGADNIGFCGERLGNIGVENATPTTNQIPAIGGTFVPGGVMLTANAIPTIAGFNSGYKTEMEYCIAFDTDAAGDYLLRLYRQNGTALTYTQTPQISIVNPSAPAGF